jgi:Homeodomain
MTGKWASAETQQTQLEQKKSFRSSISESLEHLTAACQDLADLAADAAGITTPADLEDKNDQPIDGLIQQTFAQIFRPEFIPGYSETESMEEVRLAYLNAAVEMYRVMAEDTELFQSLEQRYRLALRIGEALHKELLEFYQAAQHGNERATFTTEQRTALESAFLLKPKLNMAEKRALAKACNLNPRQVEVWVRAQTNRHRDANSSSSQIDAPARSGKKDECRIVTPK